MKNFNFFGFLERLLPPNVVGFTDNLGGWIIVSCFQCFYGHVTNCSYKNYIF
jgi:hypothetical protein